MQRWSTSCTSRQFSQAQSQELSDLFRKKMLTISVADSSKLDLLRRREKLNQGLLEFAAMVDEFHSKALKVI